MGLIWDLIKFVFLVVGLTAILIMVASAAPRSDGCITSLPRERVGYWRYRIVKGRKCWYAPRSGRLTVQQAQKSLWLVEVYQPEEFNPIDAKAPPEPTPFELRWKGWK